MPPTTPAFVPANGAVDLAVTIAVLVIAFIGWLVQIAGQVKGKPPGPMGRPPAPRPGGPAANRPRPRDDRLQTEIDAFLREVAGGRKAEPKEDEVAIEVIEDDEPAPTPRRLAPAQPPAPREAVAPMGQPAEAAGQLSEWDREQQRRRERLLSTLAERHLESTPLGADLRKHIEQYMSESIQLRKEKEQVERRLAEAHAELRAMRAQAGGTAASSLAGAAARGPGGVAALLRNRRTVKDAIVINEVLGRPRALRYR